MSLFTTGGALPPFKFNRQADSLWISEMRLRVVPGFISPLRASVVSAIPLQRELVLTFHTLTVESY